MDSGLQKLLCQGLVRLKIDLDETAVCQLVQYFTELKKWNRKVNLIAKNSSDEQIIEAHFIDSLVLVPYLRQENAHLLDIGTGGGFPGLICKAVLPPLQVSLVEPRQKRVHFLRHLIRMLALEKTEVFESRIEDEKMLDNDSALTHITSRAVTEIGSFLEMVERFAPSGPTVICMKGPKWKQELGDAERVIKGSNYSLQDVKEITLHYSKADRSLLFFKTTT